MAESSKVTADREQLVAAQARGGMATLGVFVKLSGPGWLQSAITLGGGSLAGSLFLGVLGGTKLLWLQLVAIAMGVVMLSAISYVTLSTGEKPFRAINKHINPVLGWGWLIATIMANMIWCMPQFSLCFAALQKNLIGDAVQDSGTGKLAVSAVILVATSCVVLMNRKQGLSAKVFDIFLKALVGMIVICFFGVVIYLGSTGGLDWGNVFSGFVPDLGQAIRPTGDVAELVSSLPAALQEFWSARVVKEQRAVMIGAAATAVGVNMTFLLPYSMLNRGWNKPFRGLARFDLCTGMAIPYIVVTSCVVIASAASFHAKVDDAFLSDDLDTFVTSPLFMGSHKTLLARIQLETEGEPAEVSPAEVEQRVAKLREVLSEKDYDNISQGKSEAELVRQLQATAGLPEVEKRIVSSLVQRNAFQLSQSLAPLLGESSANYVFGLGVFAMGFSSIIILMLINGYAFCEMLGTEQGGPAFTIGCLVSGVSGAAWPLIWDGPAKLWLAILASSFGMMLLPVAYVTFFMMMNSKSLMGAEKPTGGRMLLWNVLMGISVLGALAAATVAVIDKARDATAGWLVSVVGVTYVLLVIVGFVMKSKSKDAQ